jgi:hypothetical protein
MNDHDLITTMRESFTDVRSGTPVEQIVSRSKVIRARRRVPGAVAIVAVAAAAGTAVALIAPGSAKPAPVATHTTAYVVSHVAQALDAMPGNTVVVTQMTTVPASDSSVDPMEMWSDEDQSRLEHFTLAGQPVSVRGISIGSSSSSATQAPNTVIVVDYQNKTWWRSTNYMPKVKANTVWNCSNADEDDIRLNPHEMAAQLHTALSCGELKVAGSGTVGGVPTLKLSGAFYGPAVTYWVNATTYLPFRFTATYSGAVHQTDLQWLPPTAANLAKLNVTIPAGFTQVPPGNRPPF